MTKMKKYMVYLDDGRDAYKIAVPATSEKMARKYVEGNGEVIAVRDVTKDYPISEYETADALLKGGMGRIEVDFILRALVQLNVLDQL